MAGPKSPFRRLSQGRDSQEEHSFNFLKKTISGSSAHKHHSSGVFRSVSGSNAPPISGASHMASHKKTSSRSSNTSTSSNFLAEQYERDRKSIISHCFGKNDPKTGAAPNDYITHVRIIEDAKYPTSRPPTSSTLENKKKRAIILSSKAGNPNQVQIHKARENADGSFQIGRTWDLKELIRIEKDLEVNEGFQMTMGKLYYWETNSTKERTVFVKSVVKIYIQAFEGHVPELINWDLALFYLDERSYRRAVINVDKIFHKQQEEQHAIEQRKQQQQLMAAQQQSEQQVVEQQRQRQMAEQQRQQQMAEEQRQQQIAEQQRQRQMAEQQRQQQIVEQQRQQQMAEQRKQQQIAEQQRHQQMLEQHRQQQLLEQQRQQQIAEHQRQRQLADQQRQPQIEGQQFQNSMDARNGGVRLNHPMPNPTLSIDTKMIQNSVNDKYHPPITPRSAERFSRGSNNNSPVSTTSSTHQRNLLGKAPYSAGSTISELNRRYERQSQVSNPEDQRSVTNHHQYSEIAVHSNSTSALPASLTNSQNSSKQFEKKANNSAQNSDQNIGYPNQSLDDLNLEDEHLTKTKTYHVINDSVSGNNYYSSAPSAIHDNMLENLNEVLASSIDESQAYLKSPANNYVNTPKNASNFESVQSPDNGDVVDIYDDYDDDENLGVDDINSSRNDGVAKIDDEEKELDLNYAEKDEMSKQVEEPEIEDDSNDYSYEKGDDLRYSQMIEQPKHVYHEVSTIQEEAPLVGKFEDNSEKEADSRLEKARKDVSNIGDQAMQEILNDINWELDDEADDLVNKLNKKLDGIEYSFNNDLLSLQNLSESLSPYEKEFVSECDKLNPVFSLFLMEMNSLLEDIEYVESQNNGLQVESANKKNLWIVLTELLNTVSLNESALNELLNTPISERNLPRIELQLEGLFRAIKAIKGENNTESSYLGGMQALATRRQAYEKVTKIFLERVEQELERKFSNFQSDVTSDEQLTNILSRMLIFSSLTSFSKNISPTRSLNIIEQWTLHIHSVYQKRFLKMLNLLQRKITEIRELEEELPIIQNQEVNLTKQWVEYRQTKKVAVEPPNIVSVLLQFMDTTEKLNNLCVVYQNFVDNFFHITTDIDFNEFLQLRRSPNYNPPMLLSLKDSGSDREATMKLTQLVSRIFQDVVTEISESLNNIFQLNKSFLPSVLILLENQIRSIDTSNQEFLLTFFTRLSTQAKQLWIEYVDDQVAYYERIVINFSGQVLVPSITALPIFVKNTQDLMSFTMSRLDIDSIASYSAESMAKDAFEKLSSAVVEILSRAQNENKVGTDSHKDSDESKDISKIMSLLINSYWLSEMLPIVNADGIFDFPIKTSRTIFDNEKNCYAKHLLQKSMPKLSSFVNGATNIMKNANSNSTVNPSRWAVYSKQNLDNILASYSSKEIDILVSKLFRQMHDEFSQNVAKEYSEQLCAKLWSCIQGETVSLYLRLYTLIDKHYPGTIVKFSKNDIITAFEKYK